MYNPEPGELVRVYKKHGGFVTATFTRLNRKGDPVVVYTGRKKEYKVDAVYPVNDGIRVRERGVREVPGYNEREVVKRGRRRK